MNVASTQILEGHVLDRLAELPDASVHCVVTSPPYFGLRDYETEPQWWPAMGRRAHLGGEDTVQQFVANLLSVFREVKRVLRDDGQLFVNLGDSFGGGSSHNYDGLAASSEKVGKPVDLQRSEKLGDLRPLDCGMIPARFALAMQGEGWLLRSEWVWVKAISLASGVCPSCKSTVRVSGSVMPDSISGTAWRRCRVKVGSSGRSRSTGQLKGIADETTARGRNPDSSHDPALQAQYVDCPGCDKCRPNGGLVLTRGSWRPTPATERIYQFAKQGGYYSDGIALQEPAMTAKSGNLVRSGPPLGGKVDHGVPWVGNTRNLRSAFLMSPDGFPGAHFATFPQALPKLLIEMATSDKGVCPECGAPWARVIERVGGPPPGDHHANHSETMGHEPGGANRNYAIGEVYREHGAPEIKTIGWRPTCECYGHTQGRESAERIMDRGAVVPATVLDPFLGSGTTLLAARKLGRNGIGIELSPHYAQIARERVEGYAPLFQAAQPEPTGAKPQPDPSAEMPS